MYSFKIDIYIYIYTPTLKLTPENYLAPLGMGRRITRGIKKLRTARALLAFSPPPIWYNTKSPDIFTRIKQRITMTTVIDSLL